MLEDDLFDLYELIKEEMVLKNTLKELKGNMKDIKENKEEIKQRVIQEMSEKDHKCIEYKNIKITLTRKPEKIKLDKSEINSLIEEIIDMDLETHDKRDKILQVLKPKDTGSYLENITVKTLKGKSKSDE